MGSGNIFEGRLVRLSAVLPEDAELFSKWSQDADYLRHLDTDYARPVSAQGFTDQLSRFNGPNNVTFHLRTLEEDRLIGFAAIHSIEWNNQCGLIAIGIGNSEYRGKGYGSDAIHLLLNYGFNELNLYRLGLDVIATNEQAIHVYERAGFKHEGAMRGAVLRDGKRADRMVMGILREEWFDLIHPS